MKICFLTHNLALDNGSGRFASEFIGQIRKLPGVETVVFVREPANVPGVLPLNGYRRLMSAVRGCDLIHALDGFPYAAIAFILSILFWKVLSPYKFPHSYVKARPRSSSSCEAGLLILPSGWVPDNN